MRNIFRKHADSLADSATNRQFFDAVVEVTCRQSNRDLFDQALSHWKKRWGNSENGRMTYEIFPRVHTRRPHEDFYVNEVLAGHGAFSDY